MRGPGGSADARRRGRRSAEPAPLWTLAQIQHLLRVEFGRARRYGDSLAALLVAVDGLTELRETQGHAAKERALEETAKLLATETRACDHAGRYTLERFLVLVPRSATDDVRTLPERMVAAARAAGGTSISIGVGLVGGGELLFHDDLLAAAQKALKEAQAAGGGRVLLCRTAGGA